MSTTSEIIGTTTSGKSVFAETHPVYDLARRELSAFAMRIPGANDADTTSAEAHTAALHSIYQGWTANDHLDAAELHARRKFDGDMDCANPAVCAAVNAHTCAESICGRNEIQQHGKRLGD